jgi:protein TonB
MGGEAGGSAGGVMGGILGGIGTGAAPVVKAAAPKKIAVSSGVMAGNILVKTQPQYPAIAKAARIQGTVVLQATISKEGTITNLTVVSGPPMLQQAALDAVRSWRYKPYLLNGEPVEVGTQVNVVFSLGG